MDENDEIMTEDLELWKRDPVECIKELLGNPAFREYMAYMPERVYGNTSASELSRIIDEMWTAEWWWEIQVSHLVDGVRPQTHRYPEKTSTRRCCQPRNPHLRQDAAHAIPRR